jgi:hypothetical protein
MRSIFLAVIFGGIVFLFGSCKKAASPWNFNTAVTVTFNGQTNNYVAPAGLVNYSPYEINGYQASSVNNTIQINLADSPYTSIDTFSAASGNSLIVVNDGVTYTTTHSNTINGTLNLIVKGNNITGTFNGTLYAATGSSTLTLTNGSINTSY